MSVAVGDGLSVDGETGPFSRVGVLRHVGLVGGVGLMVGFGGVREVGVELIG